MPIPLNNPKKRREIKFGDPTKPDTPTIGYFQAPGDRMLFDVVKRLRDPDTGKTTSRDVAVRLIAEHVCDWTGFIDDETRQDVPMPGAGLLPRPMEGVPEDDEEKYVTEEIVVARLAVIGRLPWNLLIDVDNAIGAVYVQAALSGKD